MANEISGFTTLGKLVSDVLNDLFAGDLSHRQQFLRWAVRGYTQLRLHVLSENKVMKFAVENSTATDCEGTIMTDPYCILIPDDCIKFIAIGRNFEGRFQRFRESPGIVSTTTESSGFETQGTDEKRPAPTPTNVTSNICYQYYYKPDERNRRILIEGYPLLEEVTLIYQSSGIKIGEQTYIPKKAEEAVLAFIHWKRAENDPKANAYDKQSRKAEWVCELNKINRLKINVEDMYDTIIDVFKQNSY